MIHEKLIGIFKQIQKCVIEKMFDAHLDYDEYQKFNVQNVRNVCNVRNEHSMNKIRTFPANSILPLSGIERIRSILY